MKSILKNFPGQNCVKHIREDIYFTEYPEVIFQLPNGEERITRCLLCKLPLNSEQTKHREKIVKAMESDNVAPSFESVKLYYDRYGSIPFAMDADARIAYIQKQYTDCYLIFMKQTLIPTHSEWNDRYNCCVRYAAIKKL